MMVDERYFGKPYQYIEENFVGSRRNSKGIHTEETTQRNDLQTLNRVRVWEDGVYKYTIEAQWPGRNHPMQTVISFDPPSLGDEV